jgi:hypothetical protein
MLWANQLQNNSGLIHMAQNHNGLIIMAQFAQDETIYVKTCELD